MLGRGSMGLVYRAFDPAIGRRVAIKLIRADLLEGEERDAFVARFRQEAQAAGRCMHPNIVTIHDFAVHQGNPFLAMEFVEGDSLAAVLRQNGPLPASRAVVIMLQVLAALGAAHALGVVHRDVKPANILLLADDRVKVTDFGVARLENASATQSGVMIGTPSYMSPEQYRGEAVDGRSDLFSAGAVLFELLTGERPFPGRNVTQIAPLLLDPAPLDVAPRLVGQSPELVAAIARALAKRRDERFASASAMAAALQALPPEHLAAAPVGTTVVARRAPGEPPTLDSIALATIERRLALYVGPIARLLVREAAQEARSYEALCHALGDRLEQPAERSAFLRSVLGGGATQAPSTSPGTGGTGGSGTVAPKLSPAATDRVQRDLTHYLGPIARVLVRRGAAQAGSEAELRLQLAEHIGDATERQRFLAGSGGS